MFLYVQKYQPLTDEWIHFGCFLSELLFFFAILCGFDSFITYCNTIQLLQFISKTIYVQIFATFMQLL